MKKQKDYTIALILVIFIVACLCSCGQRNFTVNNLHTCTDSTHQKCDGNCACDGLDCEESEYKDQFQKLQKLMPGKDSIYIDNAIKED